jgi:hypothetical protein
MRRVELTRGTRASTHARVAAQRAGIALPGGPRDEGVRGCGPEPRRAEGWA